MLSVAASVLAHPEAHVTLLYGNRTTTSVMFAEELADLKDAHHGRFNLIHVLSREPRDVELFSGRLDAERLRRCSPGWCRSPTWTTSGCAAPSACSPTHVRSSTSSASRRSACTSSCSTSTSRHRELRHADRVVDGVTSEVTVILDGRTSTTPMARAKTILDSAQEVRADLPFACKGGVCGTCRAKVCAGEVDMVRNYALEPDEVARDFVLTCQTFPVSPEVTVDFDA